MTMEDDLSGGSGRVGVAQDDVELAACLNDAGSFVVELVSFVAEATDREPTEMPTLSDVVDPEAVQRVLESAGDGSVTVTFTYAGCDVVVTGAGEMFVLT